MATREALTLPDPPKDSLEEFIDRISAYEGSPSIGRLYWRTRDLDVRDIARLMRADIKDRLRNSAWAGKVKARVRISRYAGGESIDIVAEVASSGPFDGPDPASVGLALQYIHRQYNYDASHGMHDYSCCRYLGDVTVKSIREAADGG